MHHIYPYEYYPELGLVGWNLISLSSNMHNKMHIRDSHEMTELGLQWQIRRKDEFDKWMSCRVNDN